MVWTEARGFDSIWLTEHHFIDYGPSVSPAVLAAAAAMRTRRVRIGLAAATLPFHYPIRLAEELAIVDILNEGRLDVGRGARHRPPQRAHAQLPAARTGRAARQEPRHVCQGVREGGPERRRDREPPGPMGVSRHIYVATTDAEALAEAKEAEMWYQKSLRRFLIPERIDRVHPLLQPGFRAMEERFAQVSWEQLVAESVAFGSPDIVAARVDELRRLGVGEMLCWMNFGGLPQERVRRSMELFAREVMPRFR